MAWIQETESANSHTRIQAHDAAARRFPKKEVTDPHSPVGVSHKPLQTSCQWKRYRAAQEVIHQMGRLGFQLLIVTGYGSEVLDRRGTAPSGAALQVAHPLMVTRCR